MSPLNPLSPPDRTLAVEIRGLSHSYGAREALRAITLSVRPGEIFGLLGPNGGGKSTLFRILSTQMAPTAGQAFVFGHDVVKEAAEVRRLLGVVFQSPSLDKKLTAAENLLHQGHLYGLSGEDLRSRIVAALDLVRLSARADERVEKFSGGMQRRVEVAKALLHDPKLLLLDEPSTGLDPGARRDLMEQLVRLREEAGVTSLLTTHLMEEAEQCTRIAILDRGQVVALGTPEELKARCGGEILILETREPKRLQALIDESFRCQPTVVGSTVRIEVEPAAGKGEGTEEKSSAPGAQLLTALTQAFSKYIDAARIGKPTLEDVFIRATGHRFQDAEFLAARQGG